MASEQVTMNETIAKVVAEATRVEIQAMAATATERPQSVAEPKLGSLAMKQPTFNWETKDKYNKLKTFRLEVNNILSTYNSPQAEQLAVVKNWLGRKGLHFFRSINK